MLRKRKGLARWLVVGLGLLGSSQVLAAMVGFAGGGSLAATPGSTFSLSLVGTDFGVTIEGGGVDLTFDPSVLRVDGIAFDTSVWEFDTRVIDVDNAAGEVEGVLFSSFAGRTGSFPIATFLFTAVGVGGSDLALSESPLNPFASAGNLVPVEFRDFSVSVSAVPLPAGVWLLVSGLGLVVTQMRRRSTCSHGPPEPLGPGRA